MIHFEEITNVDLIRGVLNVPPLKESTTGYKNLDLVLEPDPTTSYIGGWIEDEFIGMFPTRILTNRIIEIHIYILPKYWGTGKAEKLSRGIMKHLAESSTYNILYSSAPGKNNLGNKFLKNLGFKKECAIKDGVEYLGELMDLNIYTYTLVEK